MIGTECTSCRYYVSNNKCVAFPNGIPFAINSGRVSHRQPYKGDNGIRFEPIKDKRDS